VRLPVPAKDTGLMVYPSPGARFELDFQPADTAITRPEGSNNLVFQFDSGGKVIIVDFFAVEKSLLPEFLLPDGRLVAAADTFVEQQADTFAEQQKDLPAAAGPGTPSGGSGEYDDDPGSLIDGIDRLGSLGTTYWDRDTETSEHYSGDTGVRLIPSISIVPIFPGGPGEPGRPWNPGNP
jgi:hypothetical protein